MKFRTDFVTNSSDSSFVTVNVNNPALHSRLQELGIIVSGNGEFKISGNFDFPKGNVITLPSGKQLTPQVWDGYMLRIQPHRFDSLSAWLVNSFFKEGVPGEDDWEDDEWEDEGEKNEGSETDEELKQLFRDHGLMKEDEDIQRVLEEAFAQYDKDIVSAEYEYCYGFEGMVESADHMDIKDGVQASFDCSHGDVPIIKFRENRRKKRVYIFDFPCKVFSAKEDIINGIKEAGGKLVEELSSADIAIVGDYEGEAFNLARKEKNVSVAVSEKALACYLRTSDHESWGNYKDDLWSLPFGGMELMDFNEIYGQSPVWFSTWNGKRWE